MQLVGHVQQVGYELAQEVLCREAAKRESSTGFGVAKIVESRGQVQIANESAGSRPNEIRHSDPVVPGIRFVDESKSQRVKASDQGIPAAG